jgi:purine-binding chemotaxis protein CheW
MAEVGAERVVVCRVGTERFALPVASVRAVVALPAVARIPGAPTAVRGLVNVRGTLVTTVSGARLLTRSEGAGAEWLVVLAMLGGRVGLEVEEVEDLHTTGSAGSVPTLDLEKLIRPLFGQPSGT